MMLLLLCTLLLPLLQSGCGEYFRSDINTQNGSVNINHKNVNASVQLRYTNLHRQYPNITILRRLSNYKPQSAVNFNTSNDTGLSVQPIITSSASSGLLNVSHPSFHTQVNQIHTDLQICRKYYKDLEIRLADISNRYTSELMRCEDDLKLAACNETLKNSHLLLDNTTDELLTTRSDLAACVANTEGLEFERDKYIAKYMRCTRLTHSAIARSATTTTTTTVPTPIVTPANTVDSSIIAVANLQWQYSSCMQELQRSENQLRICKHNVLLNTTTI